MTARRINLGLWPATTLLASAAVVALLTGIASPLATIDAGASNDISAAPATAATASLDQYALVWSRPLRDLSGKSEAPAPATSSDGPELTLAGTVGHSVALLRTRDGAIQVRAVGETLAGAQVVSIEPYKVTLRIDGKLVTLDKPRPSMLVDRIR